MGLRKIKRNLPGYQIALIWGVAFILFFVGLSLNAERKAHNDHGEIIERSTTSRIDCESIGVAVGGVGWSDSNCKSVYTTTLVFEDGCTKDVVFTPKIGEDTHFLVHESQVKN